MAHTTSSSKILLLALGFLVILNSVRVRASEIEGIVVDPEGRVTEGARILLSDHTTIKAITFTDENGHFSLANLDPGQYELRVALSGFRADTIAFQLAAEELLEIRIQLRIQCDCRIDCGFSFPRRPPVVPRLVIVLTLLTRLI